MVAPSKAAGRTAGKTFHVKVQTNTPWVRLAISDVARRQMPFAMAHALTMTAGFARDDVRDNVVRKFTIRNQSLLRSAKGGFLAQRAEKKDWPNPQAAVFTRMNFWKLHETGGQKRPERGAKRVAIPTKFTIRKGRRGGGGKKAGSMKPSFKPKAIRKRKTARIEGDELRAKVTSGNARRLRFPIFYLLKPSVRIKPELEMREVVFATAKRRLNPQFNHSLGKAIRTDNKGPRNRKTAERQARSGRRP